MSYQPLPDHVRRIIDRDGEVEFTPPSFERWLGRLQMLRTLSAMGAFLMVFFATYGSGLGWEGATVRAIVAALVFHFFAWAAGLFIFGELYGVEVKTARKNLEERERDRARRIEQYYRDRLRAQGLLGEDDGHTLAGGTVPALDHVAAHTTVTPLHPSPMSYPEPERRAA